MNTFGKTLSGIVVCGLLIVVNTASNHALGRQIEHVADYVSDSAENVRCRFSKFRKKNAN